MKRLFIFMTIIVLFQNYNNGYGARNYNSFSCLDIYKAILVSDRFSQTLIDNGYGLNTVYFRLSDCWMIANPDTILHDSAVYNLQFVGYWPDYLFFYKIDRWFVISDILFSSNALQCQLIEQSMTPKETFLTKRACKINLVFNVKNNKLILEWVKLMKLPVIAE